MNSVTRQSQGATLPRPSPRVTAGRIPALIRNAQRRSSRQSGARATRLAGCQRCNPTRLAPAAAAAASLVVDAAAVDVDAPQA